MVRLRAQRSLLIYFVGVIFQFQNGTIKRLIDNPMMLILPIFQFQNGTIKSSFGSGRSFYVLYFNSKMVRLREKQGTWEHQRNFISIPKWYD